MPIDPVLRRQRQVDLWKFMANLVYKESSKTARAIQRNLVSKIETKKEEEEEHVRAFCTFFSSGYI